MVNRRSLHFPDASAFDLDGCLADTILAIHWAVNQLRVEFGKSELSLGIVRDYMGVPLKTFIGRVMTERKDPPMDDPCVVQAQELYGGFYSRSVEQYAQAFPGIPEILEQLLELNIHIAVCTNKSQDLALKTLEAVGLNKYFDRDCVIGGDTFPNAKPHPEPLHYLIKRFQTIPEKFWMVGDSSSDILVAKAAGCISIRCSYGYGDIFEYDPDAIIDEPKQLLILLEPE